MSDLGDLTQPGTGGHPLVIGKASNTPADAGDDLFVTIDAFDGGRSAWGPCPFMPRATTGDPELPAKGDRCLVAFDETGSPWVVVWEAT